jgi:hypothetical protein
MESDPGPDGLLAVLAAVAGQVAPAAADAAAAVDEFAGLTRAQRKAAKRRASGKWHSGKHVPTCLCGCGQPATRQLPASKEPLLRASLSRLGRSKEVIDKTCARVHTAVSAGKRVPRLRVAAAHYSQQRPSGKRPRASDQVPDLMWRPTPDGGEYLPGPTLPPMPLAPLNTTVYEGHVRLRAQMEAEAASAVNSLGIVGSCHIGSAQAAVSGMTIHAAERAEAMAGMWAPAAVAAAITNAVATGGAVASPTAAAAGATACAAAFLAARAAPSSSAYSAAAGGVAGAAPAHALQQGTGGSLTAAAAWGTAPAAPLELKGWRPFCHRHPTRIMPALTPLPLVTVDGRDAYVCAVHGIVYRQSHFRADGSCKRRGFKVELWEAHYGYALPSAGESFRDKNPKRKRKSAPGAVSASGGATGGIGVAAAGLAGTDAEAASASAGGSGDSESEGAGEASPLAKRRRHA